MALLYQPNLAEEAQPDTSIATRRSSRIQRHDEGDGLRPRGHIQKPSQGLQLNGNPEGGEKIDPRSSSTRIKRGRLENAGSVDKAMERLRKMENNFHDAIQRQKRMVDESLVSPPKSEESAFFPRPEKVEGSPILSPGAEKQGLDQVEPIINEEKGGKIVPTPLAEAEPEDRNSLDVPEENDINLIKREGARPPPVHSDYVPLPWKGRLGYVNHPANLA